MGRGCSSDQAPQTFVYSRVNRLTGKEGGKEGGRLMSGTVVWRSRYGERQGTGGHVSLVSLHQRAGFKEAFVSSLGLSPSADRREQTSSFAKIRRESKGEGDRAIGRREGESTGDWFAAAGLFSCGGGPAGSGASHRHRGLNFFFPSRCDK